MENYIRHVREDGTIEYRHPNYNQLMAEAEALPAAESPEISAEEMAATALRCLRKERDKKLAETDWWATSDRTMTTEQTAYRQALRDITNTYNSLETVVWPTKP